MALSVPAADRTKAMAGRLVRARRLGRVLDGILVLRLTRQGRDGRDAGLYRAGGGVARRRHAVGDRGCGFQASASVALFLSRRERGTGEAGGEVVAPSGVGGDCQEFCA